MGLSKARAKIMVIDDNLDFLSEIAEMLQLSDYEATVFPDGIQALREFERVKPDVVLLDLKMPHKDGFQVAQEIRRNNKSIPIIAISAFYNEREKPLLDQLCVRRCINKPLNPLDIIAEVEKALS